MNARTPERVLPPADFRVRRGLRHRLVQFTSVLLTATLFSGCTLLRRDPTPGRTTFESPLVSVPATLTANTLIVELSWDKFGPWRFLVDTGSSVTLVSTEMASRYITDSPTPQAPKVSVRSASGETTQLTGVTLRRISIGDVRFDRVPALIYDFTELSDHLGERIDGVLGFPLFRQTILTLDYPQARILLSPAGGNPTLRPGSRISFDTTTKIPLIPIDLDGQTLVALVDSGSDGGLHLNPVGLETRFLQRPRPGGVVATLSGERDQQIGRLEGMLKIGSHSLPNPIVDLTDELSSIGGGILKNFVVTFDQRQGELTLFRESTVPLVSGSQRSAGLSFKRTPAYWRVVAVVPGSPANEAGVQVGDLLTRIDDEPVSAWPLQRYEKRIATAEVIDLTFLHGLEESIVTLSIFDLVE